MQNGSPSRRLCRGDRGMDRWARDCQIADLDSFRHQVGTPPKPAHGRLPLLRFAKLAKVTGAQAGENQKFPRTLEVHFIEKSSQPVSGIPFFEGEACQFGFSSVPAC